MFAKLNKMEQQNPYQVKSKRFRRRAQQNEAESRISISQQKRQFYQSPSIKKIVFEDKARIEPKQFQLQKTESILSAETQNQTKQSCVSKPKLKLRRKSEYDQQIQIKLRSLQQLLKQKEEKIKILQNLLEQKNFENALQQQNLNILQNFHQEKIRSEQIYQQEIQKLQLSSSQQSYKLAQKIKKLEIDLVCSNKKWRDEFDRIIKEKDQQIRSLRQKFSNLLRFNRQKLKVPQILSQPNFPTPIFKVQNKIQSDSFELSVSITE